MRPDPIATLTAMLEDVEREGQRREAEYRAEVSRREAAHRAEMVKFDIRRTTLRNALAVITGEPVAPQMPGSSAVAAESAPRSDKASLPDPEKNPKWAIMLKTFTEAYPETVKTPNIHSRARLVGITIKPGTLRSYLAMAANAGLIERLSPGVFRLTSAPGQRPVATRAEEDAEASPVKDEAPNEGNSSGASAVGGNSGRHPPLLQPAAG